MPYQMEVLIPSVYVAGTLYMRLQSACVSETAQCYCGSLELQQHADNNYSFEEMQEN